MTGAVPNNPMAGYQAYLDSGIGKYTGPPGGYDSYVEGLNALNSDLASYVGPLADWQAPQQLGTFVDLGDMSSYAGSMRTISLGTDSLPSAGSSFITQIGEAGPLEGLLGSVMEGAGVLGEAAVAAAPFAAAGVVAAGVGYGAYKLGESFDLW